jgi:ParB-like chromosome segregation protein Spo0J
MVRLGLHHGARDMQISAIKVGKRCRHSMGDIASLVTSIAEVGLLHPVVVDCSGRLIAGERRLNACIELGWTKIPATVVDLAEIRKGELAENAERKDFLPSEIYAISQALEPTAKAEARERQREAGRKKLVESFHKLARRATASVSLLASPVAQSKKSALSAKPQNLTRSSSASCWTTWTAAEKSTALIFV